MIGPGLVILLSGAGLSFAKEIDRFMQPSLLSVAASGEIELPKIQAFVASQLQRQPHGVLRQIKYPQSPYDPITLTMQVNETLTLIYLNPHTGKLLGQRPQSSELSERLRRLHVELMSPSIGQLLAVIVALALVLMIGLGVCLARVDSHWRFHTWHARLGAIVAPILLAIVGSGLVSVYGPGNLQPVAERFSGSGLSLNFSAIAAADPPSVCTKRPVSLTATDDGPVLRCGNGSVFSLVSADSTQEWQPDIAGGNVLWNLHSGEWAGLLGRGIWMWSVLAVLYLLYSGVRDWWRRINKKNLTRVV